jgi:hypothetical protein
VANLTPTRKIVYKKVADRELSLHVFQPEGWKASDKRVGYITIHGGGWTGMGPERMYAFADHFAKLGLVSISVQYRLANAKTNTTVFDCVKDVRTAMRYVRAHANELGIDPGKNPIGILKHRHLGTEAAPDAAEFEADVAAADHDHALGQRLRRQRVGRRPDALAVEGEAGDLDRRAADGEHDVLRFERLRAVLADIDDDLAGLAILVLRLFGRGQK